MTPIIYGSSSGSFATVRTLASPGINARYLFQHFLFIKKEQLQLVLLQVMGHHPFRLLLVNLVEHQHLQVDFFVEKLFRFQIFLKELPLGAIIGIAVGGVVLLALVLALVLFLIRRRRQKAIELMHQTLQKNMNSSSMV